MGGPKLENGFSRETTRGSVKLRMKSNKTIPIILLVAALGFAFGWFMKPNDVMAENWTPDKISLYYNEVQKDVTKIEQSQYFKQILRFIVFEQGDMMSGGNPPVSENDVNEMKKSTVEYVYTKPISIQINNGNDKIEKIQFTSILFPLDNKWNGAAYIRTTDLIYLYLTSRPSLDFILKHM
ncbi:hypothetical protein [Paenibacillus nasutitermitis]|uniref:Uncharacterized protein n=1 Tax=Paenibacillus nasutitermitis TaxID=1652958 RepID=A0A917DSH0_9BACL|nr:hypothetical protein [Paenibacillus nasutitermitis]GGD62439.1 hypothetical protein GCM10010911_20420 [Paenibacillus nasutitermitis]